jgi:ring-1,2-phenylacetyl-CoA epoxidase subunit PaaC
MFDADELDEVMRSEYNGPDLTAIAAGWRQELADILAEATLTMPGQDVMARGGKQGRHSEHFGYLIAELQILQRSYPGATW